MNEEYYLLFPNYFKGPGQPAFTGTNKAETRKAALWRKKDKNGRDYFTLKTEDVVPKLPEGLSTEDPIEKAPLVLPEDKEEDDLFPF